MYKEEQVIMQSYNATSRSLAVSHQTRRGEAEMARLGTAEPEYISTLILESYNGRDYLILLSLAVT